jgi:hypothetical protein
MVEGSICTRGSGAKMKSANIVCIRERNDARDVGEETLVEKDVEQQW